MIPARAKEKKSPGRRKWREQTASKREGWQVVMEDLMEFRNFILCSSRKSPKAFMQLSDNIRETIRFRGKIVVSALDFLRLRKSK